MKMFEDIGNQLQLRFKLFWKDKMTVLVFLAACGFFLFCMADLNLEAEEKASIPIGVVDLDGNNDLVERLERQPALSVITGDYEELEERMLGGYIRCILVISQEYSGKIQKGNVKSLISVYHEKGDNVASVITDIVAGEMMYDICLARAYEAYAGLPEEKMAMRYTREEYEAYTASLIGSDEFDFAIEFRYLDSKGKEKQRGMDNSLLYRQAVAAVAAMLMTLVSFTAMAGVQLEKGQGIAARKKLLSMGRFSQAAGNLLAAGLLLGIVSAIFAGCVSMGTRRNEVFLSVFGITILFSLVMAFVYYLWARLAPGLLGYQAAGVVFLLLTGIAGFCSMAEGAVIRSFPAALRLIPNCVYLKWFVSILS